MAASPPAPTAPFSTTSFVVGLAVGGLVSYTYFLSRGHSSRSVTPEHLRNLENALRNNKHDIVKEVSQGLTQTATHLRKSMSLQEATIQKSLLPVAAAQQQLTNIDRDIGAIKNIFKAPATRGRFGEFQLETLIRNSMPTGQYKFQHTLTNKKRVDCVLELPSPIGMLAIDSKFPFDPLLQSDDIIDSISKANARTKIQESLSKHINDVASRYIVPGETANYAIMFIPSESLFLQIVEEHPDVLFLANQKCVYLACPTTLLALLTQLHGASRGMALEKQTMEVSNHVQKLMEDVDRLVDRFEHAEKSLEKARGEVSKMQTSIGKIRRAKAELEALGWLPTTTPRAKTGSSRRKSASGAAAEKQEVPPTIPPTE